MVSKAVWVVQISRLPARRVASQAPSPGASEGASFMPCNPFNSARRRLTHPRSGAWLYYEMNGFFEKVAGKDSQDPVSRFKARIATRQSLDEERS